eukprot:TRINITY_DN93730_c0_g1_i1.p1 TRINITY_DN93730_c0_g1~~TRINITY_DN93730_c0_g1_i1.p1  ORF type:complete len:207 (+),score=29.15 TRINITY_DN93730_c0_g1_i1:61-681(+)
MVLDFSARISLPNRHRNLRVAAVALLTFAAVALLFAPAPRLLFVLGGSGHLRCNLVTSLRYVPKSRRPVSGNFDFESTQHQSQEAASRINLPSVEESLAAAAAGLGPDPSCGYDIDEYRKLWSVLDKDYKWPSVQRISVVGPMDENFRQTVEDAVWKVLGWEAAEVKVEPRNRWQAVRLAVRCISPDDFCKLHSHLKNIDGVRQIL